MDILNELQAYGYRVQQCPGRLEILSSLERRQQAHDRRITVFDQINEALDEIVKLRIEDALADAKRREEERLRELGRYRGYNDA